MPSLPVALVCPASFKGHLLPRQAARAMAEGAALAGWAADERPVADGGEGTLDALARELHTVSVSGPYGDAVDAAWGVAPDGSAVVEMARASGILLAPRERRDLRVASTFGTGQLLKAAMASGARWLIVGLGGSATNDGGMGAMRALGARFLDATGSELTRPDALVRLDRVDLSRWERWPGEVIAAVDVDNPLTGSAGATRMFGPQKGGTAETLELMEASLVRYGEVLERTFGWKVSQSPGAGAAGGIGAALLAFLGARFKPGVDVVLEATGFDAAVQAADVLLTGEGRLDAQSLHGKSVAGVLRRAQGRPVVALCGRVDLAPVQWKAFGFADAVALSPEAPPADMATAVSLLREGARRALLRRGPT